jgi:hypothetical protein
MEINLTPKNAEFCCNYCDFICSKNSEWIRHINTKKHIHRVNGNNLENAEIKKNAEHICNCGKKFSSNSGLWKHNQKCKTYKTNNNKTNNNNLISNEPSDKELIVLLINENKELKNMMIEQQNMVMKVLENGTHNNHSHNTTNSHNKAFNLNFFLNETCKDAMNIMDFVDSIKLQLSDLEKVGEIGYVEGISKIITKNLKALDITQRPIHCTDKKREVLYVKDEDKWEKEDEDKNKLKKAIKRVVSKNQRLIPQFKEKHPDCGKSASKFSDQYNKIIVESMGGPGDNDYEKEEKIIQKISREVIVDK